MSVWVSFPFPLRLKCSMTSNHTLFTSPSGNVCIQSCLDCFEVVFWYWLYFPHTGECVVARCKLFFIWIKFALGGSPTLNNLTKGLKHIFVLVSIPLADYYTCDELHEWSCWLPTPNNSDKVLTSVADARDQIAISVLFSGCTAACKGVLLLCRCVLARHYSSVNLLITMLSHQSWLVASVHNVPSAPAALAADGRWPLLLLLLYLTLSLKWCQVALSTTSKHRRRLPSCIWSLQADVGGLAYRAEASDPISWDAF